MSIIGLDLSLNSPGITVLDQGKYYTYFFPTRKREYNFHHWVTPDFEITALPPVDKKLPIYHRYKQVTSHIECIIFKHNVKQAVLESAFFAGNQSDEILCVLGGLVKSVLFDLNIPWFIIAPPRLKRLFAGHGRSDKKDMYKAYIEKGFPDILIPLQLKASKSTIPVPAQDIVDSVALITCYIEEHKSK